MSNPLAADLNHILDHTRDLWDELRGQRIFLTGGTGFFGCWLLESFVWANEYLNLDCEVTVLSRAPDLFRARAPHLATHSSVSLLQGDTAAFDFPPGEFSHIIHAATYVPSPPMADPQLQMNSNLQATNHVLHFAEICRAKKFLFTSSGAVYGKQPSDVTHLSEEYPGAPATTDLQTAYGQSKRVSEFLCTAASASGMQVKIARCFAFAGPYLPLDSNYAIGNFVRDALRGDSIRIEGDGTPYRSYLYAADLAVWLWTILFAGRSAHPYNVGSDADLTIADLAAEVVSSLGLQLEIRLAQQPVQNQPPQRYVPSIERAKNELGLRVQVPLPEAIRRMAAFYAGQISKQPG